MNFLQFVAGRACYSGDKVDHGGRNAVDYIYSFGINVCGFRGSPLPMNSHINELVTKI